MKAGGQVEIKAVGKDFKGKYFIESVKHKLVPGYGYTTYFNVMKNAVNPKESPAIKIYLSAW